MKTLTRTFLLVLLVLSALPAYSQVIDACGCEDKALPLVLATVNKVKFTRADISPEVAAAIRKLQKEVIEARNKELDLQINGILLGEEAKKRGIDSEKILQDEIAAKITEPTDTEVQAYYDQNKGTSKVELNTLKPQIVDYLRERQRRELAKKLAERFRAAAQLKIAATPVTPPANQQERNRVFATINGRNITSGDIEDSLQPLIFSVQEQVYSLLENDLDLKVNNLLLDEAAKKKGVESNALLNTEVYGKIKPVSDDEAQTYYTQNKGAINAEYATVKTQIIQYLKQQAEEKAEDAFVQQLRGTAQVQFFLKPPERPAYKIATDDQPAKGNPNATVTLVEFTDFQCPSCALQQPILDRLITEYGSKVNFVVRDFPLVQHENAVKAAEAAECAREQGKYWEYAALLFRNQTALQVDKLKAYATELQLDQAKFNAALDSGKFKDKVARDLADGEQMGIHGTPTIYVNGKQVANTSYEGLKAIIETSLKGN